MVNSILLHLDGTRTTEAVIAAGVELALRRQARVRGLSLADTRRLHALSSSEAGVYVVAEHSRLARSEVQQGTARADLSQACLAAGLDFDVRRLAGDPFDYLPGESQFHDLVVAGLPAKNVPEDLRLSARDWIDLLYCGVQPLLIVRSRPQPTDRVLLVYDGSAAAGRAIRTYLGQSLYPGAEHRLLVTGRTEAQAKESLRQMAEYCRSHDVELESGWICGSPGKVLIPYARKWQAELVVMGATRGNGLVRRLLGETAQRLLHHLPCALYIAA